MKTVTRKKFICVTLVAACILAAIFAIHAIIEKMNKLPHNNGYSTVSTPYVIFNDETYYFSGTHKDEIPDNYRIVGKIGESVSEKGSYKIGESNGCHKGELIFMSEDDPDELYVYSTLFAWDEYLFTKFEKSQN